MLFLAKIRQCLFRSLGLCAGVVLWSFQLPVLASQDVTLTWNASPDPSVAGYKLYFGQQSRNYDTWVDAGNVTSATISLPVADATYYLAATTYDAAGNESDFSNELVLNPPAATTSSALLTAAGDVNGMFSLTVNGAAGVRYVVEASTNLSNWVALETNTATFVFTDTHSKEHSQRFYRSYAM